MSKVYVDPAAMSDWKTQMDKINQDSLKNVQ